MVEEGHDHAVGEDHVGRPRPGDDLAEDAVGAPAVLFLRCRLAVDVVHHTSMFAASTRTREVCATTWVRWVRQHSRSGTSRDHHGDHSRYAHGARQGVMVTDLLPSTGIPTPAASPAPTGSDHGEGGASAAERTRLVLDTSVLIADPTCVLEFVDADVVVPLTVVEELDGLKSRSDDVGRAARTALRTLEDLRVRHGGSLAHPVPTGKGSATLQIEINNIRKHLLVEHGLDPAVPDNRIIGAAIGQADFGPTTIISNDAALRIKAAHLGVSAAEHQLARRPQESTTIGWSTIDTRFENV